MGGDGAAVHRVVTRRLRATAGAGAFLRSVRARPAAVLLAKGVVREAQRCGAAGDRSASLPLLRSLGALRWVLVQFQKAWVRLRVREPRCRAARDCFDSLPPLQPLLAPACLAISK